MREAPRVATWILRHFTTLDDCASGDLLEQYRRGRSSLWYWRQTVSTVAHSAMGDIAAHPIRAAVTVGVGWAVVWWGANRALFIMLNLPEWLFATGLAKSPYVDGLTVPIVLRQFPVLAAWKALVYAGSGWIVARMAYASQPSMVLVYAAFVIGGDVVIFVQEFGRYSLAQLTIDLLILYPLAAVAGGLCGCRHPSMRGLTTR